jgi:hypothetical protein
MRFAIAFFLISFLPSKLDAQNTDGAEAEKRDPTAIVEVIAFDTFGGSIPSDAIHVEHFEGNGTDYAQKFRGGVADDIPLGEYQITVSISGFQSERRMVNIRAKRTAAVVGMALGEIGDCAFNCRPYGYRFQGKVVGHEALAGAKAFVKLISIFGAVQAESEVDSDGTFDITVAKSGRYLSMVVSQAGIFADKLVRISEDRRMQPKFVDDRWTWQDPPPVEIEIGTKPILDWQ